MCFAESDSEVKLCCLLYPVVYLKSRLFLPGHFLALPVVPVVFQILAAGTAPPSSLTARDLQHR